MLEKLLIIMTFFALFLLLAWLNKRLDLGLDFNDSSMDCFGNSKLKEEHTKALQARVETLEKIVTEPAYDLRQQFKHL